MVELGIKIDKECIHSKLHMHSGDYYISCHECGRTWTMNEECTNNNNLFTSTMTGEEIWSRLNGENK